MNTLETNSTPPSEPDKRAPSPPPPPVSPRSVSLWEHLGSTLVAALPTDNEWSRSHGSGHGTYHAGSSSGNRGRSSRDSDPLPEPFTLFGGRMRTPSPHRCRSPSYSPPPPLPPRPPSPATNTDRRSARAGNACMKLILSSKYTTLLSSNFFNTRHKKIYFSHFTKSRFIIELRSWTTSLPNAPNITHAWLVILAGIGFVKFCGRRFSSTYIVIFDY